MDMPDWLHRNAGLFSPQRLELLVATIMFLERLDYIDHHSALEQVDSDSGESAEITARIELILQEHLRIVARQHGVILRVDNNIALQHVLNILEGLVDLGNDFNVDVLVTTFDDDAGPEWILATWLQQVIKAPLAIATIALMIDRVEYSLIEAINRRLDRLGDAVTETTIVSRYKRFIGERREGLVYDFIRRRRALPHYFIHTAQALGPDIANLPLNGQIAWEWASLALSSERTDDTLLGAVRDAMEDNLLPEQYAQAYPITVNLISEYLHDQI